MNIGRKLAAFPKKRFPDVSEHAELIKRQIACKTTTNCGQEQDRQAMLQSGRICVI